MSESDLMRDLVTDLLKREKIEYKAVFVPQSISRNAGSKDKTLNWKATFTTPSDHMVIDYAQGIGHVPGYQHNPRQTMHEAACFGEPWETGKYNPYKREVVYTRKPLPAPHAADILHCIIVDSTDNHDSFEEWAREYGYDTDSRKAEETYNACRKQTRNAQSVFGAKLLAELASILEQY